MDDFFINCDPTNSAGSGNTCTNYVESSALDTSITALATETFQSVIICTSPGMICINELAQSGMVYLNLAGNGTQATTTITNAKVLSRSGTLYYPFINAYYKTTGTCSQTATSF